MKVMKLDRNSEGFYNYMGPIFGSRIIEQNTKDRFYDDEGKTWYLIQGKGVASVVDGMIKNFWAATPESAVCLLETMMQEYEFLMGIVPSKHEDSFRDMGFRCEGYRKNFLEVHYHAKD